MKTDSVSNYTFHHDVDIKKLRARLLRDYYPTRNLKASETAALQRILETVELCGAVTCVVEHGYYDVDFRSEYSLAYSRQASVVFQPDTDRLHFFASPIASSQLWTKKDRKAEKELKKSYLGYVVMRPDRSAPIGRTMLRPPPSDSSMSKRFESRIRTLVREDVQLASLPLEAVGVPFMEQNRTLLNCATVSAWSVHYAAVLRGIVPRMTTASLWSASTALAFNHRSYPASSMDTPQLVHLLSAAGLPPETLHEKYFAKDPPKTWSRRPEMQENQENQENLGRAGAMRERLTSTICRYLNSGLPVLLCYDSHVVVACGYLRESDVDASSKKSDVVKFIVNDEARGPYLTIDVDDLAQSLTRSHYNGVIVPLPDGVFLSDRIAELFGESALYRAVEQELTGKRRLPASYRSELTRLKTSMDNEEIAVRTYVADSYDFKMNYVRRCPDEAARRALSLTRMPEYVWVVEAVDRKNRDGATNKPVVLGEILLDASVSTEYADALYLKMGPCISTSEDRGTSELYESGWSAETGWLHRSVGHKAKTSAHRPPSSYGRKS